MLAPALSAAPKKEAQTTVFQQCPIVWIRDVMRAFLMFIFLKKRKKCHDSYIISQQKACNHIANEIVQRNTLNRSTVQDRKSINDRISLILRRHRIFELIEIDFNKYATICTEDNARKSVYTYPSKSANITCCIGN
jgi:hypothetical protein